MNFSTKVVAAVLLLIMFESSIVRALYRTSKLPVSQASRVAGVPRSPMTQPTRFYSENSTIMPKNIQETKKRIKNWELELQKAKAEWVPLQREKINTLLLTEKERLHKLFGDLEAISSSLQNKKSVAYYYSDNEDSIYPRQQQYYPIVYNNKSTSKDLNYYLQQIQPFKSDVEKFKMELGKLLEFIGNSSKPPKMSLDQYNQTVLEVKKMATSLAVWIMTSITTIVQDIRELNDHLYNRSFLQLIYEKALGTFGYHTQYYKDLFKNIEDLNNKRVLYENIMKELSPYIDKRLKSLRRYSDGSSTELFKIDSSEYHPERTISIEEKELEKLKKEFEQESKQKNNNLLEE